MAALAGHPMDRLVHWDIRNDNLLVRPTGEVVFVDWGAAGVGPDWLDPLLARSSGSISHGSTPRWRPRRR